MSVCSRRMKCSVSSEVSQPWAASADTEGMGLLVLVTLALSERVLTFMYSSVHPKNIFFLQEDILKPLLEPTRLSVVVNH